MKKKESIQKLSNIENQTSRLENEKEDALDKLNKKDQELTELKDQIEDYLVEAKKLKNDQEYMQKTISELVLKKITIYIKKKKN